MKLLFLAPGRRKSDFVLLLLTLALSPLLIFPGQESIAFCLIIPAAWLLSYRASGYFLPETPLNFPLAILAVGVFINVLVTPDLQLSLGKLSGTVFGLLFFFALTGFLSNEERIRLAFTSFGLAGGLFGALTLLLTNWKTTFGPLEWVARTLFPPRVSVPGFDDGFNPNPVAGTLALFLPLLLILSVTALRPFEEKPRAQRAFVIRFLRASLALVTFVLVLTQSRGAWIASSMALLFLGLAWSARRDSRPLLQTVMKALFFLPVLGGIPLVYALASARSSPSIAGLIDRGEIWARAFWAIQDFPATGMGANMFRVVSTRIYPFCSITGDIDIASAHNVFLQTGLDLGLPATAAYTAIWFALFKMLYEVARNSRVVHFRNVSVGLAGGLLAYCTFQIADAVPLGAKLGVFWWGAAALAAAMYRSLPSETPSKAVGSPFFLLFWGTAGLASISLAPSLPVAGLLLTVGSGVLIGLALVPGARPQIERRPTGHLNWLLPVPSRPKVLALAFSCLFFLPLSVKALRANLLSLRSIRDPERVAGLVPANAPHVDGSEVVELRSAGNAHWQLGNNRQAAEFFQQSLSQGDERPLTLLKCVIANVKARDFPRAERVMRQYECPSAQLAEFARTAGLSHDRSTALLCADFFLSLERPDPDGLCEAKEQYSSIGSFGMIAGRFVAQVDEIDPAEPIDPDCRYELGLAALGQQRLDLAHRLLDAHLLAGPRQQAFTVRAKGCYASYRFNSFYNRSKQIPPYDYRSLAQLWCRDVDTWYSEIMLADEPPAGS